MAAAAGARILVIGGGGFIGRHVVAAFVAAGHRVSVLDLAPPGPRLAPQVDWITGAITDPALVASAAMEAHSVVFLANTSLPASSQADLAGEVDAHVAVTVRVADICQRMGVARFVFASSGGTVYGTDPAPGTALVEDMPTFPRNAYGVSKLAIEHYLRIMTATTGMNTICLRISNPYGEGQRAVRGQGFVAAALSHALNGTALPIWGDGCVERDFIHVSDVAAAFVLAAQHSAPPPLVNIGSGEAVSLTEVVRLLEGELGSPIRVVYEGGRAIDVRRNVLDISRAKAALGWVPRVGLGAGLARTVAWWRTGAAPPSP